MSDTPRERGAETGPSAVADEDLTPYQITLRSMIVPLGVLGLLNLVASSSLALAGAPIWMAAAGFGLMSLTDLAMQRTYRRWTDKADGVDPDLGLRRLCWPAALRACLWFAAPVAYAVTARSPAGLAVLGVMAMTITAVGVARGWASGRVLIAMIAPPVLAVAVGASAVLSPLAAVGVVLSLAMLCAVLGMVALSNNRVVTGWTRESEEIRAALARSEAAERRLRVAIGIADLHVFEVDYVAKTLVSLGAESDFFEQPLTYKNVVCNAFGDVADDFRPAAEAAWADYEAGKGPYRVEYRVKRADGKEVWAFATSELTRDETGRPKSLVGALHNITERKRGELQLTAALDRAEAGSRAKSEFLATMSHEIRTPLNGVLGMAQAMGQDRLSARQRGRLEVIRRSGESLLTLLNSVLDLSKIEAGKFELDEADLDVAAVARAALDAFGGEAAGKGLALNLEVSAQAEGLYRGDPARLGQVLYNLVSNAVKFTPKGSVTLSVDRADGLLTLVVADTGIGVSPEQREALFEKFVQADSSVTRRFGGTGLGLAICRQLVAMMGGTIGVAAGPAGGTAFTVSLPLVRLEATGLSPASAVMAPNAAPDAERAPLRVLAAEDNEVNRLVLQTLLQQVGIEPTLARDGVEALAAWHAGDWDVILMDVQMPVLDGISATQAIRAEEAETGRPRTPIVALTANVMSHQIESYRAAGVDDVVGKPIEIGRLLQVMGALIDAARDEPVEDAADRYFG